MAKESSSFVGGILGVVIGVILIGGIAGTPFYLDMFMQEERAIDKAVEEDVDTIRRAALNLDQHLAAIQDVEGLLEDDQVVTGEIAAEVAAAHPDVFSDLMMQSLGKTASMLRRAQDQDQQRGVDSAVSIQTGQPNARACVQRMKTEYLVANQKLRRVAESSIQTLRPLQRGGKTATSRLAVARVHAVFYFAVGKMLANRAEFLHDQTSFLRRQANDELRKLAAVQRDLDVLDAESPLKALADLRERMLAIEGDESGLNERISLYTSAIESLTDRLGSLDVRATKAREEMAKSEAAGAFSEAGRSGEYLALASEARSAEAEATMVRNCLPQSLDSGETAAQDEGAQLGLRDLRLRLEQAETVLGAYREARADLEKREEMLTEQARVIADQQSTLTSQAAELLKEATRLVSEAGERAAAAEEAAGLAQAEFDRAATFAGHALRAAAGIKREAQTASSGAGSKPDERLEAIKKDGDTEATIRCLAAEIAYFDALTRAQQIQTLRGQVDLANSAAEFAGEAAPNDLTDRIQQLRQEADEKLVGTGANSAAKHYEAAIQLLKGSSVRTDSGTISGSNYLWQVQMSEAAVYLLRSTISPGVDGRPDRDSQNRAYDLLKEAAEGREESPLLAPAVDTLLYLQDAVK